MGANLMYAKFGAKRVNRLTFDFLQRFRMAIDISRFRDFQFRASEECEAVCRNLLSDVQVDRSEWTDNRDDWRERHGARHQWHTQSPECRRNRNRRLHVSRRKHCRQSVSRRQRRRFRFAPFASLHLILTSHCATLS